MEYSNFDFETSRGLVWVCDIENSTGLINSNDSVVKMEEFLRRLHWISHIFVSCLDGVFVKWTGDGFLAWFETPFQRDLGKITHKVLHAIFQMSIIINVTQLGLDSGKRIKIKHSLVFEPDACITKIKYIDGHSALDITGRSVVLGFRLAGISTAFPSVVLQKQILDAVDKYGITGFSFKKMQFSEIGILKYFKGNTEFIDDIYCSVDNYEGNKNDFFGFEDLYVLNIPEHKAISDKMDFDFAVRLEEKLKNGFSWQSDVMRNYLSYLQEKVSLLEGISNLMSSNITGSDEKLKSDIDVFLKKTWGYDPSD